MQGILNGTRVLDFGSFIAAPYCATLLAELGAEVIRIEKVDGGDDRFYTPVGENGEGALLSITGRNKKGMTLNPTKPEGSKLLNKLLESTDIVIANKTVKGLQVLNLDYDNLKRIKPDIILVSISAYGNEGPYAERIGFDNAAQALCGATYMTGDEAGPRKSAVPYCDYGTASLTAFSTMAAIMHRQKTGEGQWVKTSLLGTALAFNNLMIMEEQQLQLGRQGVGNYTPGAGPSGVFQTRDGVVFIQVIGDPIFKRWTSLLGIGYLREDTRYNSDQRRGDHAAELNVIMQEWCAERSAHEVVEILNDARIPCEEILPLNKVLDHPQIAGGGFFNFLEMPGFNKPAPLAKAPFQMSATDSAEPKPPPLLGEHTDELLLELGYSGQDIKVLRESRVV